MKQIQIIRIWSKTEIVNEIADWTWFDDAILLFQIGGWVKDFLDGAIQILILTREHLTYSFQIFDKRWTPQIYLHAILCSEIQVLQLLIILLRLPLLPLINILRQCRI